MIESRMPPIEPRIVVSNVTASLTQPRKRQREGVSLPVVRSASFEVAGGGIFVLAGAPGEASALARVIAGLERPAEGSVHTTGRVAAMTQRRLRTLVDLKVSGTLVREGRLRGFRKRETVGTFPQVVETAGYEGSMKDRWSTVDHETQKRLDHETQKRLMISVILCSSTPILVVDGVLPDDDPDFTDACITRLGERTQAGLMSVIASGNEGVRVVSGADGAKGELVMLRPNHRRKKTEIETAPFWLESLPFEVIDLSAGAD
jgi:ABC-type polysaccharide/polyol phosphate transport system ATPase subunit